MNLRRNSHLTFKGNFGAARHDWLRLTPAYSYQLVQELMKKVEGSSRVLDPFAGTGTTGLAVAERGMVGRLVDVNPFLVWLARAKTRNYSLEDIQAARQRGEEAARLACGWAGEVWVPPIHGIDRWWQGGTLRALGSLRQVLDRASTGSLSDDLLTVAFCRVLIDTSNAAFNHQSMSFKTSQGVQTEQMDLPGLQSVAAQFLGGLERILRSASGCLAGEVSVSLDDARRMDTVPDGSVDLILTSPPYANRISYIRELRPYMYWLRFLKDGKESGQMDWNAIGGTWGVATSRLASWQEPGVIPLGNEFRATMEHIARCGAPHGRVLSKYVAKYFFDMYEHFESARRVLSPAGTATYIVGNSTFYGNLVPTERWYAELLAAAGFTEVTIRAIRKRNSKQELYEFEVTGKAPSRKTAGMLAVAAVPARGDAGRQQRLWPEVDETQVDPVAKGRVVVARN